MESIKIRNSFIYVRYAESGLSTEEWLDEVEDKLDYDHWFFGHFHTDTMMGNFTILYEGIEYLSDF